MVYIRKKRKDTQIVYLLNAFFYFPILSSLLLSDKYHTLINLLISHTFLYSFYNTLYLSLSLSLNGSKNYLLCSLHVIYIFSVQICGKMSITNWKRTFYFYIFCQRCKHDLHCYVISLKHLFHTFYNISLLYCFGLIFFYCLIAYNFIMLTTWYNIRCSVIFFWKESQVVELHYEFLFCQLSNGYLTCGFNLLL